MQTIRQAAVLALGLGLYLATVTAEPPEVKKDGSSAAWVWVSEAVEPVTTSLVVKLNVASEQGFAETLEWQVVVTASDGWGLMWIAVIQKPWEGEIHGRFFELQNDNLDRQLFALRRSNPTITVAEAVKQLSIASGSIKSTNCQSLLSLAHDLEGMVVPVIPDNSLSLHAPSYFVRLTTAYRSTQEYSLYADEGKLAQWCGQLLLISKKCNRNAP